uniref:Uncharacterized protein n=1 Tax=Anguilla anguilla TaxID=7936 RepID=A0A0E9Q6F5_ANGAN
MLRNFCEKNLIRLELNQEGYSSLW